MNKEVNEILEMDSLNLSAYYICNQFDSLKYKLEIKSNGSTVDCSGHTVIVNIVRGDNTNIRQTNNIEIEQLDSVILKGDSKLKELESAIEKADISKLSSELEEIGVNVKNFGALGDGVTDSSRGINEAITYAKSKGINSVFIPSGTYIIESPIILDGIKLFGTTNKTVLKQKSNTTMESIIKHEANYPTTKNIAISDLIIDGSNNVNDGIILNSTHYSTFENIEIRNVGRDALVLTGVAGADWNKHCTTNKFNNINVYTSGRYPIFLDVAANDNHFINCNIGDNNFEVKFSGGSNTISDSVIWGTRSSQGIIINAQQTIIRDCNIEGNAKEGIVITAYGSHSKVSDCKFMANSKLQPGVDVDIYIAGEGNILVENIDISNNIFKGSSTFNDGIGYVSKAISMESTHKGIAINGNKFDYETNGSVQNITQLQVEGLKAGDIFNNVILIDANTINLEGCRLASGQLIQDLSNGFMKYLNPVTNKFVELVQVEHESINGFTVLKYRNAIKQGNTMKDYIKIRKRIYFNELSGGSSGNEIDLYWRSKIINLPIRLEKIMAQGNSNYKFTFVNVAQIGPDKVEIYTTSTTGPAATNPLASLYVDLFVEGY